MNKQPGIPLDDELETTFICAVRYCFGRQSYMPSLVMDYLTPMLPKLSLRTLSVMIRDIEGADTWGGYGSETIDKPRWMRFQVDVKAALDKKRAADKGAELEY